jgi:hypothetical protein
MGLIDLIMQSPFSPRFAYNNTYGVQAISLFDELNAASAFLAADGCQQLTLSCRAAEASLDPSGLGNAEAVNSACARLIAIGPYTIPGRCVYDISQNFLNPFPDLHCLEYLNTRAVQQAIGVPVNYTRTLTIFFAPSTLREATPVVGF